MEAEGIRRRSPLEIGSVPPGTESRHPREASMLSGCQADEASGAGNDRLAGTRAVGLARRARLAMTRV
eukprot:9429385-Pyramimonas_sp.AAC.1